MLNLVKLGQVIGRFFSLRLDRFKSRTNQAEVSPFSLNLKAIFLNFTKFGQIGVGWSEDTCQQGSPEEVRDTYW